MFGDMGIGDERGPPFRILYVLVVSREEGVFSLYNPSLIYPCSLLTPRKFKKYSETLNTLGHKP